METPAPNRPLVKTFLTLMVVLLAALSIGAGTASAKTPCWKTLIADWYDGRIDGTYPVHCYNEATKHLPDDIVAYSGAASDIHRALLAAIRKIHKHGGHVTDATLIPPGGGGNSNGPGGGGGPSGGPKDGGGGGGAANADKGGGTHGWLKASSPFSVPLPLLILGGVALLLLLAAGGSVLARRMQERRLQPAPATPGPPKQH